MGDSILDWITGPGDGWQQLLGMGSANAAVMPPPPPQQQQPPPPPPPNVMANAPRSFAPNSSFDGGGLTQPQFNDRFSPGPEPSSPSVPMPPPRPPSFGAAQQRVQGGAFGNMDGEPIGWRDGAYDQPAGGPMSYAGPETAAGFGNQGNPAPPQMPPAGSPPQGGQVVNRTVRNGQSFDSGDASVPPPRMDYVPNSAPPSTVLPGGLAASLGATPQLTPAEQNMRTAGNVMSGLGRGLSAVGQLKPGTFKGTAFAAGAGGALEGYGHHADTNLDRDLKQREHDATLALRGATLAENQRYHQDRTDVEREKMVARLNGTGQNGAIERLADRIREEGGKDKDGNYKISFEDAVNRARRGTATGQGGSTEHLARELIEDAKKDGKTLSLADAIGIVRRAPNSTGDDLRKERVATERARGEINGDPSGKKAKQYDEILEKHRRSLGLSPNAAGPLPLGTRRGVDPERSDRSNAPPVAPAPPPAPAAPTPAAPEATGAALSRPVVPGSPAPTPRAPPGSPPVEGAGYSATTGKWYVRGPDGTPQEVSPQQ